MIKVTETEKTEEAGVVAASSDVAAADDGLTPEERELLQAKLKLAAKRKARDDATKGERTKLETRQTLQRAEDEDRIAEAEDKYGAQNVKHVFFELAGEGGAGGVAIVKRCSNGQYIQYVNKGKDDYHAQQAFVAPNLVYPSVAVLEQWLKLEPFKITSLAGMLTVLAGVTVNDNLAK